MITETDSIVIYKQKDAGIEKDLGKDGISKRIRNNLIAYTMKKAPVNKRHPEP
jgi:hypothetical protein